MKEEMEIEELFKLIKDTQDNAKKIKEHLERLKSDHIKKITDFAEAYGLEIDQEKLKEFFKEFYYIHQVKDHEWLVVVPSWIPFSIGWFEGQTKGYNIFKINNYTQWIGETPEFLVKELGIKQDKDLKIEDNTLIFPEERTEEIVKEYGSLIGDVKNGKGKIRVGKEFDIVSKIIEHGGLPFLPKEVDKNDLRNPEVKFKLEGKYSFQMDAWKTFLKYGAVGLFYMTGAGKSFITMYILDSIKGKKVLFVPFVTLREQWMEYFKEFAPRLVDEVEIYHYSRWEDVKDKEYSVAVFDECSFLPAPTYAVLSTLKTKYRLGLSASPFREDQKENLIFALTGYPIGLGWKDLMKILGKRFHEINVHIVEKESDKIRWVERLFNPDKKTFISTFRLDIGKEIAEKFKIPFVSGETKNRMDILRNNRAVVISKVGEYGISIKDLQHVIEVDFHFGSRQDELQLTGRILHGSNPDAKHDIIFTKYEYLHYGKRLNSLVEKGFMPRIIPHTNLYEEIKEQKEKTQKIKTKRKAKKYW